MGRKQSTWLAVAIAAATLTATSVGFLSNLGGAREFLCSSGASVVCARSNSASVEPPAPDPSAWVLMENDSSYASNYQRRERRPTERFNQVVTVYDMRMTDDRRVGLEIASGEYLVMFKLSHDSVVVQIRQDHGIYWLLSRQTFSLPRQLTALNPESGAGEFQVFRLEFQDQIDETRHFLSQL